jgi:cytochrome c oxidase subunit 2
MWNISLFPESASTFSGDVDRLFFVLVLLSFVFAVPVAGLIVYFAIKYRRGSKADRSGAIHTSHTLEALWIAVPLVLALGIFGWSSGLYVRMYERPPNGIDIYGVGKQWMWQFEHPSGQREINELHVPVNTTVRLTLIAQDVIHSFYVPAFRVKRDVVPGLYTTAWFEATKTGRFHLFCAEYCGTRHSGMIGEIVVMEPRQYEDWLTQRPLDPVNAIPEASGAQPSQGPLRMESAGETLFRNFGCATCHVPAGQGQGPSLVGLLGSQVQLASGATVLADEQYIRRSIIDPNAQIVAGYPPIMPTFAGQISEEELLRLVEYIRSLSNAMIEGG